MVVGTDLDGAVAGVDNGDGDGRPVGIDGDVSFKRDDLSGYHYL
ncbi:hypothetical protein DESC_660124 [Desulfosarcina cetonica]|nr:hypothetical protein DESC_660124 [Desulfosarcina cetonica]